MTRAMSWRGGPVAWMALVVAAGCAAGPARAQAPVSPLSGRAPQAPTPADSGSSLRLAVSVDTILFPPDERWPIVVRVSRPMAVVATLAPASQPSLVLWRSDTLPPGVAGALAWDLRTTGGEGLASGRYVLEVTAGEPGGWAVRARRSLALTRLAADTLPLPRPLGPRELEPESVQVRQTAPWAIFIGAAAGLLPAMIGRRELNDGRHGDPKTWIVVSTVTVAGFVAFFAGHRQEFSPENAAHNVQRRRDRDERLASIVEANARARVVAPYRIQVEGGQP